MATYKYDYTLDGINLLAATSEKFPKRRRTTPPRKEQFDNAQHPGEQSVAYWWLRSQNTYHYGTGITVQEPASNDEVMGSFADSRKVDVWTPGEAKTLHTTSLHTSVTSGKVFLQSAPTTDGGDYALMWNSDTLKRLHSGGSSTLTWGGTGTILAVTNDGDNYYAANATSIFKGDLVTPGSGSAIWSTGSSDVVMAYVKQRLIACIGTSVYELNTAGTGGPSLPTAKYTHPLTGWNWTCVAEGTNAIYVAGYSGSNGGYSAIYKFVLNSDGSMPTLSAPVLAAKMPPGVRVEQMLVAGPYIILSHPTGIRVGVIHPTSGDITYGPQVITLSETASAVASDRSPHLEYDGRYVYISANWTTGTSTLLYRMDLANPKEDGTFPYAKDIESGEQENQNGVAFFGTSATKLIGVENVGVYAETFTPESQGYILTGKIRMGTYEPKSFKWVNLRVGGTSSQGSVEVKTVDAAGTEVSLGSVNSNTVSSDLDMLRSAPEEYLSLKFYINRTTGAGPKLNSW